VSAVRAPDVGRVVEVLVAVGEVVAAGQEVVVESMKVEIPVTVECAVLLASSSWCTTGAMQSDLTPFSSDSVSPATNCNRKCQWAILGAE
jgi:biotin-dependent enzyme